MSSLRILDLFCGPGGAGEGYRRAGFEVTGVDVAPQRYIAGMFVQADALAFLAEGGADGFDAIHASPPCQFYSSVTPAAARERHPDLIGPTRDLLVQIGLPYVIENVERAPLIDPKLICGTERGLRVDGYRLRRHRLFETNWSLRTPGCGCTSGVPVLDVSGGGAQSAPRRKLTGGLTYKGTAQQVRQIMEMPWATKAECNEAIPPAYTELIGKQLAATLSAGAANSQEVPR